VTSARTLGQFLADEDIVTWLAEQIADNHRASDRGARAVAKQHQLPMHCSTCTAAKTCCSSFVLVRLYEGVVLADHLKRTGRDAPALRAQLRERAAEMEAAMAAGKVADWATPCVFLDDDERCGVYGVRPTTCAQLYVYTPPALCNARSSQIASYTPRAEVLAADEVEEVFRDRLSLRKKVGRRYFGVLPRMVLVALEAWERTDFRDHLRQLPWPSNDEWAAAVSRS
jgi:Fe-S-cluster containining protein